MGGLMAFLMASLQPSRIAGMVINDIGPEIDPVGLARIQRYVGVAEPVSDWAQAAAQARALNELAFPDYGDDDWLAFARRLYVERDGVPVLAYDPAIAAGMADPDASQAVPPDLWPLFEAISAVPMLVIRGELSDILAPDCVTRMLAIDGDLRVVEVPRVGHAPMLSESVALAAIDDFLADLSC
jgi:pimeloyl-ACP methyl ester carboxylesterase